MQRAITLVILGVGVASCSSGASDKTRAVQSVVEGGAPPAVASDAGASPVPVTDAGPVASDAAPAPSAPDASATQAFATRCAQNGVIVCQGFDDPSVFAPATYPGSGLYPGDTTVSGTEYLGTFDSTIAASGAGSLKFTVPSMTGSNPSGYWRQLFASTLSAGPTGATEFGAHSTFYVQFAQRFSPEFLTNVWPQTGGGKTYWKQSIFSNDQASCADLEITTVDGWNRGYPQMYSQCGADGFEVDLPGGDILLEQGNTPDSGYNCHYQTPTPATCFMYPPNEWVTFYYEVTIGTFGQPDSTIQAWVSVDGAPYQEWINLPNHTLLEDTPGNDYDMLTLLPYMTDRDSTQSAGPTAYTWYDELIVSTEAIAVP